MIGGAGKAISGRRRSGPRLFAPAAQESSGAASVANRVDALTKLTALLELGVLTQEQHDAEYARVIECDAGRVVAQRQFGPVQLLVMPFAEGNFDVAILQELRRLREHDMIRLLDLLLVAKDELGNISRLEQSDLTVPQSPKFGSPVAALFGLDTDDDERPSVGGAVGSAFAHKNGWPRDAVDTWFPADAIPAGGAAAIALVEHRWAVPLRDMVQAGGGRGLVDRWVHPEDLIAIGAEGA
jgi:hypothetical protein